MLAITNQDPFYYMTLHFLNDKIIGRTTSGNYSFCFNKNLAFGYIDGNIPTEKLKMINILRLPKSMMQNYK